MYLQICIIACMNKYDDVGLSVFAKALCIYMYTYRHAWRFMFICLCDKARRTRYVFAKIKWLLWVRFQTRKLNVCLVTFRTGFTLFLIKYDVMLLKCRQECQANCQPYRQHSRIHTYFVRYIHACMYVCMLRAVKEFCFITIIDSISHCFSSASIYPLNQLNLLCVQHDKNTVIH